VFATNPSISFIYIYEFFWLMISFLVHPNLFRTKMFAYYCSIYNGKNKIVEVQLRKASGTLDDDGDGTAPRCSPERNMEATNFYDPGPPRIRLSVRLLSKTKILPSCLMDYDKGRLRFFF
jgi:hypothetical protein